MIKSKNKCYVTTPIYYVTAAPHLGTLYSTVLADAVSRWNKVLGKKTFLLTGTDEHGQKIAQAAQRAGKDPQAFVDGFSDAYKNVWRAYDIDYNYFIRTTDKTHVKAVQGWITMLQDKGEIYKSLYKGWYCTPDETFITEKEIKEKPTGDSGPACPSCGRETTWVSEECYFFKLSRYQDKLLTFYKENPNFLIPKERMNEVINFVKSGLKDLSISRTTVSWGIPFPGDKKHVTYVWADALNNYITAIGYGQPKRKEEFDFWWPADVQVLGKDIVRFHAIYWPAFLMASGLPLPKRMLVHGWITVDKKKMSKSLGNVIDPLFLRDRYGSDQVRYHLLRQLAINQDGDFSIHDLEQRINADLANDLGNLLNRMVSLAEKHVVQDLALVKNWSAEAVQLRAACKKTVDDFCSYMDNYTFHMALSRLWTFIHQVNAFFHAKQPWTLAKQDKDAFVQVISATAHSLRAIAILLWPIMPRTMEQLLKSLGIVFHVGKISVDDLHNWDQCFMLKKVEPLFQKIDMKKKGEQPPTREQAREKTPENVIKIDDFARVELVVGTIVEAQEVPKSDKLLVLQVDFGTKGIRQILAGIKAFYTPDELIGKQGVFVANLKPRTMMGRKSQGMMLFAEDADKKLQMVTIAAPVANGTRLR